MCIRDSPWSWYPPSNPIPDWSHRTHRRQVAQCNECTLQLNEYVFGADRHIGWPALQTPDSMSRILMLSIGVFEASSPDATTNLPSASRMRQPGTLRPKVISTPTPPFIFPENIFLLSSDLAATFWGHLEQHLVYFSAKISLLRPKATRF